jgi:hypothetical protein
MHDACMVCPARVQEAHNNESDDDQQQQKINSNEYFDSAADDRDRNSRGQTRAKQRSIVDLHPKVLRFHYFVPQIQGEKNNGSEAEEQQPTAGHFRLGRHLCGVCRGRLLGLNWFACRGDRGSDSHARWLIRHATRAGNNRHSAATTKVRGRVGTPSTVAAKRLGARIDYPVLVIPKLPPEQPVFGVTVKTPLAVVSDAAPVTVMVPLDGPETKFICKLRFAPASIGCVTFPEILKVVPVFVIAEMQEPAGLFTDTTVPPRVLPL